jgi:hypothetical protein
MLETHRCQLTSRATTTNHQASETGGRVITPPDPIGRARRLAVSDARSGADQERRNESLVTRRPLMAQISLARLQAKLMTGQLKGSGGGGDDAPSTWDAGNPKGGLDAHATGAPVRIMGGQERNEKWRPPKWPGPPDASQLVCRPASLGGAPSLARPGAVRLPTRITRRAHCQRRQY